MRTRHFKVTATLITLLAGQISSSQAQVQAKQDPDNFVKVEKASGVSTSSPRWRWKDVDPDFGPLPASMHVFRTEDSLDGRPSIAYYVSADLKDKSLLFTTQIGYGQRLKPAEYYQQEQNPLLVINTSFFSFKTNGNLNVVVKDGKMVAWNQPSRRHKGNDSLAYYIYTTRSALGISPKRKADVAWIFTDSTESFPYAFEDNPVVAQGPDSIPTLKALNNSHWRRWKMQTAVGGGPVLIHNGTIRVTNEEEGLFIKGEKDLHPRSALGYTRDGRIIVLAVQGRTPGKAAGVTLSQEAKILLDLGCYEALNLDGGGSSCLLVNGKETIHPSDKEGERPVPSVFIIKKKLTGNTSSMPERFTTQTAVILDFYSTMKPGFALPEGISMMNPYAEPVAWQLASSFYKKFYSDSRPRIFIFGINPGRFGAGMTGVPFTDPIRLQEKCGIPNDLKRLPELSSQFIYEMIDGYGGPAAFYGQFFFTALSPLGYTMNGKNLNYYDDKNLLKASEPYMLDCIRWQLDNMPTISSCFCLGEGENFKQFTRLNEKHRFFERIIPLPHPRWIMQYRRKKIKEYVELYVQKLKDPGPIC